MKRSRSLYRLISSGCLLAVAASSLYGAEFTVSSTADSAAATNGTLRWAIQQSNADTEEDNSIPFTVANNSSILLVQVLDDVTQNVTINGSSVTNLTVTKNVPADTFEILRVASGRCTLQDILFTGGDLFVDTDAELALNFSSDETYPDPITGSGALFKQGSARLTLEGANTWTGGCTVEAGSLVGSSTSLPGDFVVNSGARLVLTDPGGGSDTFSGAIAGEGGLAKESTHELTLDGTLTYTGGTEVLGGRLIVDPAGFSSDTVVSSGAALQLNSDTTQTFSNTVSGAGILEKAGTGTTTITGSNSYSGGTSILAGSLRGAASAFPGDVEIAAGAFCELSPVGSESFTGSITGDGGVIIDGSGTLIFASMQSYTGGTELRSGSFELNSDLSGDLIVTGGSWSGTGSLVGNLSVFGTVQPGSAGTILTVQGDATFEADSVFSVSLKDDGTSSALEVLGTTTINGGTVRAKIGSGDYSAPITYEILQATGGFDLTNNEFDGAIDNFAFLDLSVNTDLGGGVVELSIAPNLSALSDFANTENQEEVAKAVEDLIEASGTDIQTLTSSLIVLTEDEVPGVLDQLSGEALGALLGPRMALSMRQAERIGRRFSTCRPEHPEDIANTRFPETLPDKPRFAGWFDLFGVWSKLDGQSDSFDIDSYMAGVMIGLDMLAHGSCEPGSHTLRLGVAGGYTRLDALSDPRMVKLSSNAFNGALYGSYQWNILYAGAMCQYTHHLQCNRREIDFKDIDVKARSKLNGWDTTAYVETGLRFGLGSILHIQPSGSVHWGYYRQPSFREKKAEAVNLEIDAMSANSLALDGKLRITLDLLMPDSRMAEPEVYAGYKYQLRSNDARVRGRFADADSGDGDFELSGALPNQGAITFGGSLSWRQFGEPVFMICYDGSLCKNQHTHAVAATAFVHW